jgi:hypothetical protein
MKYINKGKKEKKHRLIILTDMENEEDDSQTMVRLLMYANEIDIEGLIAVTSACPRAKYSSYVTSIIDRVRAYGLVVDNLRKHADGWPSEEYLLSVSASGPQAYGMDGVGEGNTTDGVQRIIDAVDSDDPRPVYFAINAGASCLAQALWQVRHDRPEAQVAAFVSKIRVYDNTGQDDTCGWILNEFPEIFYIRSQSQIAGLYGPDGEVIRAVLSIDHPEILSLKLPRESAIEWMGPNPFGELSMFNWVEKNIRTRHGILGALYPQRYLTERATLRFLEGGGATSWIGLVNKGLYEPDYINWGGWGGRFKTEKEKVISRFGLIRESEEKYPDIRMYPEAADTWCDGDGVTHKNNVYAPVWRWRIAMNNDFQARMDWCVEEYENANHHPIASFMGDTNRTSVHLSVEAGEKVALDASASSDPDGDALSFDWEAYPEAGSYIGDIVIKENSQSKIEYEVPRDASGKQIHIILKVTDDNPEVQLTSYRRIVLDVT